MRIQTLFLLLLFYSCAPETIRFESDNIRLNGDAQTYELHANIVISNFWVYEWTYDDNGTLTKNITPLPFNHSFYCGDWYSINRGNQSSVLNLLVKENSSGKIRKLTIEANSRGIGTEVNITQDIVGI